MSKFIGEFTLDPNPDGMTARMGKVYQYQSDLLGVTVTIPEGFETDGASIPRIFWNIIPPWGRYGRAAVIHDYLYRLQKTTRRQADDTFLEGMKVLGCGYLTYAPIWVAVRLFGCFGWATDSKIPLSAEELAPNKDIFSK